MRTRMAIYFQQLPTLLKSGTPKNKFKEVVLKSAMLLLVLFSTTNLHAQSQRELLVEGVKEMLLSTEKFSAKVTIDHYNKAEEATNTDKVILFKTDDFFYRLSEGNETILTAGKHLYVDHAKKRLTLQSSEVTEYPMLVMGFDSQWLLRENMEILPASKGKVKVRIPNYGAYKEIIYTFETEHYLLVEADYHFKENDYQETSHIVLRYQHMKYGDQVKQASPVLLEDFVQKKRGKWHSQLKNYELINRIKKS